MRVNEEKVLPVVAGLLLAAGSGYLWMKFGVIPLIIVGGSGFVALFLWTTRYLKRPPEPESFLVPFLVAVAGFEFHMVEEYLGHYGPAVGRLFGFPWTDRAFVVVVFIMSGALSLVAVGLHYRNKMAGFVAALFLTTRLAECALFVFPLLRPSIQPETIGLVSQEISRVFVRDMPNYYFATTGEYYFPGMYTVVLPMAPAFYALLRLWKAPVGADPIGAP
jgi:hypothetical protein